MATPLEVVSKVYQLFGEGNTDGFLELCSDNVEWVVNGPASLEKCRNFSGIDGVRDFLKILGDCWEFQSFNPRQFLVDGNVVVVLGEEIGTDKKTDCPFRNRWAHIFDIENGKIVRFREFLCHWTEQQKPPPMSW